MRLLVSALTLAFAAPALAQAQPERRHDPRSTADCPRPVFQHAARTPDRGPTRLGELPQAWRIHTVDRRVDGCAVFPEAQKVSDRSGRLTAPSPRR